MLGRPSWAPRTPGVISHELHPTRGPVFSQASSHLGHVIFSPVGPRAGVALRHPRRQPSPYVRRVGSHITRFEACSAFTHVPACVLAGLPKAALQIRGFGRLVTSTTAPMATGWSDQLPGGNYTH